MPRTSFEHWEEQFIAICERILEEEPLYEYQHLWKKRLTPEQAFEEYVKENPDYAEIVAEKSENAPVEDGQSEEEADLKKLATVLAEQKRREEAEQRLSKFCPECARIMKKNVCACGYKRPATAKKPPAW